MCGCGGGDSRAGSADTPHSTAVKSRTPREPRLFAADSVWNRPLAANAPVATDSTRLVRTLSELVHKGGTWINSTQYSVPIVTAHRSQKRVRVQLDTRYPPLQQDFARVPIPSDAKPAAGSDRHLVVWQRSTDTMWEFWHMQRESDGWHARWGAKIPHVSHSTGVVPAPEGATATGLALAGGVMTAPEMRTARIDHALAIALPSARSGVVAAPANRTDGSARTSVAIPLGTRFRLDPRVNVDALGLSPAGRAMARALQRYGMIARDTSGSAVTFYAEPPQPGGGAAYSRFFKGTSPGKVLSRIPWDKMQVVRTPVRSVKAPGG